MSIPPVGRARVAPAVETYLGADDENDNDLDTDTKLALLSSLFPLSHSELLEVLISANGSLEKAQSVLNGATTTVSSSSETQAPPRKKHMTSTQRPLSAFLPKTTPTLSTTTTTIPSLPKPQRGKPLLLFSPEHVAALTPCKLVTQFLPTKLANDLLLELVNEAKGFAKKGSEATRFRLFDREVWSRHTNGFYVRSGNGSEEYGGVEGMDNIEGQALYTYSGLKEDKVREFTGKMESATKLVEQKVREIIRERWARELRENATATPDSTLLPPKLGVRKYESPRPWTTNAAIVNCYDGGGETVGWHADQITHLGPMCTIASVSLGVGREFGLKKENAAEGEGGVVKIWLPHNSLLVMEAGTQEEWKHWFGFSPSLVPRFESNAYYNSIYPASVITAHPLSCSTRINITYRHYRPSLAPKYLPRCRCSPEPLPGILRTVMDRKSVNYRRYFWSCQGGYQGKGDTGDGCGWFEWADWDEDGEMKGWLKEGEEGGEGDETPGGLKQEGKVGQGDEKTKA